MNQYFKSWKVSLLGLAALALVAALSFTAPSKVLAAGETINFGICATESSQNLRKIWEPFLEDMEKETGLNIQPFFASDYAGIIEGMRFNKVQLAWYGNVGAMEAVDRAEGEVFIQTVNFDGRDGYYSHIIAHKDSPINSLEDMFRESKNLSFGNGDPNSTSGYLVPAYYVFSLNNVDPKTAFKRILNSSHEVNALSVANKQVDVATNNNESLDRLAVTAPEKRALIKEIWTSPLIPSDPLVWRKDLAPEVKEKLSNFLLNYAQKDGPDKERQAKILEALQWGSFVKATNDHLIPIRQLDLFQEKSKLAAQGELNAEQKTRMAEIDAALAALDAKKK